MFFFENEDNKVHVYKIAEKFTALGTPTLAHYCILQAALHAKREVDKKLFTAPLYARLINEAAHVYPLLAMWKMQLTE